jgi:hypothetical protein
MNDADQKRAIAAAAAAEIQAVLDALRAAGETVAESTGYSVLAPEPRSVMDARRGDLQALLAQVRAGERALKLALGWVHPGGDTLGNVLKVIPLDAATELTEALRACGLLGEP